MLFRSYRHIRLKTAELFEGACRVGALLAGRPREHVEACAVFGRHLGIAYQIYDDLVDLLQDDANAGKTLGTDAASGKLTLPMLLDYLHNRDRVGLVELAERLQTKARESIRVQRSGPA